MATTKQDTLTPYEQKFSSDTIKQVKTEFGGFLHEYNGIQFESYEEAYNYRRSQNDENFDAPLTKEERIVFQKHLAEAYDVKDYLENRMQPTQKVKNQYSNAKETERTENLLLHHFQAHEESARKIIEQNKKTGALTYDELYMHMSNKFGSQPLDFMSVIMSTHPQANKYNILPFFGSIHGIEKFVDLKQAVDRIEDPQAHNLGEHYFSTEPGQKDVRMLIQYLDYQNQDMTFMGKVAGILRELPSFGGEILATKGTVTLGRKTIAKALEKQISKIVTDGFKKKLAKVINKNAITKTAVEKVFPATADALLQGTFVGSPRIALKYKELTLPEFDGVEIDEHGKLTNFVFNEGMAPWKAFRHAWGDVTIEFLSEHSGGLFKKLPDVVKSQAIKKGLIKSFKKTNPSKTYTEIMEMLEKVGYHGIFEEFMEERLGSTLRMSVGLEEWELPSMEQWAVELTAFAIPGVTATIIGEAVDQGDKVNTPDDEALMEFVQEFTNLKGKLAQPVEVGMALAEKMKEERGLKDISRKGAKITKEHHDRVIDRAGEVGTSELIEFWDNEAKQDLVNISVDWYRDSWTRSLDKLIKTELPELADLDVKNRFKAITTIFSQANDPGANLDVAIALTKEWEKQGSNPLIEARDPSDGVNKLGFWSVDEEGTKKFTGVLKGTDVNVKRYMGLLDYFGGDTQQVEEFLMSTMTGGKLLEISKEIGTPPPKDTAISDKSKYGAEIFGPKIGAYWLNHSGVSDIPTIDRWMTRQIRRWMGSPLGLTGGHRFTSAEARDTYSEIKKLEKVDERKKKLGNQNSRVEHGRKLASSFANEPSKYEMIMFRNAIIEITNRFNEATGETLGVDQIQALLWYMEQDLYLRAGTSGMKVRDQSYEEALDGRLQQYQSTSATSEGIGTGQIVAEQDLSESAVARKDSETGDRAVGEQSGEADSKDDSSRTGEGVDSREDDGRERVDEGRGRPIVERNRIVAEVPKDEKDIIVGDFLKNYRARRSDTFGRVTIDEVRDENTHVYMSEDKKTGFLLKETPNGEEVIIDKIFTSKNVDSIEVIRDAIAEARTYNKRVSLQVGDQSDVALRKTKQFKYVRDLVESLGFEMDKQGRFNYNRKTELDVEGNKWWGMVKRKFVNRFDTFGYLSDQITKMRGLYDREDIETVASLVDNKIKARIDRINNIVMNGKDGILDRLYNANFTIDDLSDYLLAQHTEEGNRLVRKRIEEKTGKKDRNAKRTGLENKEAKAILDKFRNTRLPFFAKEFRNKVIRPERKIRLDAGLIDSNTFDAWENMFEFYVPIRNSKDHEPGFMKRQHGFEVKGSEAKRIRTGVEEADNVVVTSLMNLEDAIMRAENNQVGLTLLNLVREFGLEGVSIRKMRYRPIFDDTGEIDYMGQEVLKDNQFVIKELGEYWVLESEHEGLNNALNKVGTPAIPILDAVNSFMRGMITLYNPEFWISNYVRDLQTAGINLSVEEGTRFSKQVVKNTLSGGPARGIYLSQMGRGEGNEWAEWYQIMKDAGGVVSWGQFENFEEKQLRILKEVDELEKKGKVKLAGAKMMQFVNAVGDGVEQGVRLSAFRTAVEQGISQQRAARMARNLTVDFNRKGEYGSIANTLYLFANAGIQGTSRLLKVLSTDRGKAIGASLVTTSYGLTMMSMGAMGDDDEEGNVKGELIGNRNAWDELSDWEKYNNIIWMTPGGVQVKLRVPYGYNVFHAVGVALAEMHIESERKGEDESINWGKHSVNVLSSMADAFSPIPTNNFNDFVPTAFGRLGASLASNKDWKSSPIVPPTFSKLKKSPRKVMEDTPKIYEDISDGLFFLQGGEKVKQKSGDVMRYGGLVDAHPNQLQYVAEFFTGGVGKLINRSLATGEHLLNKETLPPLKRIPFSRLFVSEQEARDKRANLFRWLEHSESQHTHRYQMDMFHTLIEDAIDNGSIEKDKANKLIDHFIHNIKARHGLLESKERKPKVESVKASTKGRRKKKRSKKRSSKKQSKVSVVKEDLYKKKLRDLKKLRDTK